MDLHNIKPPQVGDVVLYGLYMPPKMTEVVWVDATVTKVKHTEHYPHLRGNSDPELCDRVVSIYVDLAVPLPAKWHHQDLEGVVMDVNDVGYSHNPAHGGMWCHHVELRRKNG